MSPDSEAIDPVAEARERYLREREKRMRTDGLAQYKEFTGEYEDFDRDPWVEPGFTRDAVTEDRLAVIVGGGFGGMLTSVELTRLGIRDFRIIEKAGDFGGTWYWNRYPGCMCDVESYTYMPLLEETGYMPTEKYASATEIFEHCQRIGGHFDLYPHALFQTEMDTAEWDESTSRWTITTTRGDHITAKFLITAGGILHKAKLPGIEGIETFAGRAFHTARWDYDYTGGSATTPMDKLADKRVGIIGTGATAVQVVPQLARTAKEVYVFQRTPSAVGVRNNGPTDEAWYETLQPGWQEERMRNFTASVTGEKPERDLVGDGWTKILWENTNIQAENDEQRRELDEADMTACVQSIGAAGRLDEAEALTTSGKYLSFATPGTLVGFFGYAPEEWFGTVWTETLHTPDALTDEVAHKIRKQRIDAYVRCLADCADYQTFPTTDQYIVARALASFEFLASQRA